jgi:putative nucleotidyltransferase with HDIG domain
MYLSTIGAFSTAIEAKDGVTSDHVHRVQAYALGLARALGVTDAPTLQALEAAALLHDTGKLAVPEHILNKPGKLTPAEFERMKAHVDVGADILSTIDFPYPVVPIVRAHHENWDGTGYPRGLCGEEIPIGARILAVVDCFDALTSDRPYRPAMSEEDALAIIIERRGTMYDPHVVDTFLRMHRDITSQTSVSPHSRLHGVLRRIREQGSTTATIDCPPAEVPDSTDPADPLLAFVSLARIVSQRPTLQDLGALAARQLHELAPGATVVLFTIDAGRGVLAPAYAAGPDAARVGELAIDIGRQVSGWVAATWQPMINADARIDLAGSAGWLRFTIALPLVADGRLAGVLTLYAPEPFSDRQAQRLEMIAPHFAICVDVVGAARQARQGRQANRPRTTAPRDFRVITRR